MKSCPPTRAAMTNGLPKRWKPPKKPKSPCWCWAITSKPAAKAGLPAYLGDRDTLDLPGNQEKLLRAIVATGKPVILLLLNGRPVSINFAAEHISAILEGWYLGQEGGQAVAEVLFGETNPGGKLPITFPRSVGQIPVYYYHKPSARRGYLFTSNAPLFPFGHGLSYTTFAYGEPRLDKTVIAPNGAALTVDVTNTGERAGDEVVQLYIRDVHRRARHPPRQTAQRLSARQPSAGRNPRRDVCHPARTPAIPG